jgi:hypothetical protein
VDLHWGTFTRGYHLDAARAIAVGAVQGAGYEVWNDPQADGYIVLGGNNDVAVTIALVPQGDETWISVIANSTNGTAEHARNAVRDRIPEAGRAPAPIPRLP